MMMYDDVTKSNRLDPAPLVVNLVDPVMVIHVDPLMHEGLGNKITVI